MRQAGRSLPEYREIRERHAFFEVNRSAELTAEVTLQPVRRHGVDAAVMFADIMTPVVGDGRRRRARRGRRPGRRASRSGRWPRSSSSACPTRAETVAPILEAIGIVRRELAPEQAVVGFCGGPFTVAGYLVEGKPSRDFAVTKTLMYRRAGRLARAARQARRDVRGLRRGAGAGRRRRRAAVRLVGRRPLAGRLRRVRRAVVGAGARRAARRRRPVDPLRHRHARRCSRRWRRRAAT